MSGGTAAHGRTVGRKQAPSARHAAGQAHANCRTATNGLAAAAHPEQPRVGEAAVAIKKVHLDPLNRKRGTGRPVARGRGRGGVRPAGCVTRLFCTWRLAPGGPPGQPAGPPGFHVAAPVCESHVAVPAHGAVQHAAVYFVPGRGEEGGRGRGGQGPCSACERRRHTTCNTLDRPAQHSRWCSAVAWLPTARVHASAPGFRTGIRVALAECRRANSATRPVVASQPATQPPTSPLTPRGSPPRARGPPRTRPPRPPPRVPGRRGPAAGRRRRGGGTPASAPRRGGGPAGGLPPRKVGGEWLAVSSTARGAAQRPVSVLACLAWLSVGVTASNGRVNWGATGAGNQCPPSNSPGCAHRCSAPRTRPRRRRAPWRCPGQGGRGACGRRGRAR